MNSELEFNLNEKRPKVLMTGNGLFYCKKNNWENTVNHYIVDNRNTMKDVSNMIDIPATIKTLFADLSIESNKSRINNAFRDYVYKTDSFLSDSKKINEYDAIITTNYTYDLENLFMPGFDKLSDKKKKGYSKSTVGGLENHYYLRTYNSINDKIIWHIHGELRNSNSVVLSQTSYAALTKKVSEYIQGKYKSFNNTNNSLKIESWVDYFIFANIDIIGHGLSFEEFDLWWLFNKRRSFKNRGKITYYSFDIDQNKKQLLKSLNIDINDLGYKPHEEFYKKFF